jgi:hypothetical protein
MAWIQTVMLAFTLAVIVGCGSDAQPPPTRAVPTADVPTYSEAAVMRIVAESICPAQPSATQELLRSLKVSASYTGRGIWTVSGNGQLQGKTYPLTWQVDERSGIASSERDIARVIEILVQRGGRC